MFLDFIIILLQQRVVYEWLCAIGSFHLQRFIFYKKGHCSILSLARAKPMSFSLNCMIILVFEKVSALFLILQIGLNDATAVEENC